MSKKLSNVIGIELGPENSHRNLKIPSLLAGTIEKIFIKFQLHIYKSETYFDILPMSFKKLCAEPLKSKLIDAI